MEPCFSEPAPTLEEVEKALIYTRDGIAAGPDEKPIELLKLCGKSHVQDYHVHVEHRQMAGRLDTIHFHAIVQEW